MSWRQQLGVIKQDLHSTFAGAATYTRAVDGVSYPVTARLHRKTDTIGEGDGYSQMIVEVDRVVLFDDEIRDTPQRGDKLYLKDEKMTVEIDTVEPGNLPEIFCNVLILNG